MFTNNHRLLQNSPSWPQFKIRSAIVKAVFHFRYIISLFIQQPYQIIARRIEIFIISLVKRIFNDLFIDPTYLLRVEAVTPVSA